ncbi:toll/interleukin-1 receptor domain-containing protein [Bacillus kwashiorkori]|uniref:toll/interleukin-1 receptor domain-containing protein n=1 Tax=Bacillus kwashiorkori TaxID=1522318 RepID=UPI000782F4C7|nr:toll/interleukin-1 receptor domain-containing protein [Bacillus kwashiorkori]
MIEEKQVFLSYSWNDSDEADIVQGNLSGFEGISVLRDRDILGYSSDITRFMKRIKKTDHAILLISNSYLESVNCMFEVSQLIRDEDYIRKITPILVKNVTIYSIEDRLKYAKYWNDKYNYLNEEIRKLHIEDNVSLVEELKKVKDICSAVDDILSVLNRHQFFKLETHIQNEFNDVFKEMGLDKIPKKRPIIVEETQKEVSFDYVLHKLDDVSNANAKRYSAVITLSKQYERDELKELIVQVTNDLKIRKYYRNDKVKSRHLDRKADVVWLYIANDTFDVQVANWICRTSWISEKLLSDYKPLPLKGNDKVKDIVIDWNGSYESYRKTYKSFQATKEDILEQVDRIKERMLEFGNTAVQLFEKYKRSEVSEEDFIQNMQSRFNDVEENFLASSDLGLPPEDIKRYVDKCHSLFSTVHNMYNVYSEKGVTIWDTKSRDWQMSDAKKEFDEIVPVIRYEEKAIH